MAEPSINEILRFALGLSAEAGRFIMPHWKNVAVEHKSDGSEVTEADRGAEQLLRDQIAKRYPDHAIWGEEFGGAERNDAEHLWLIDPLDGTASFAIGLPLFGTLIAYLRHGSPCVGVIGVHALKETVYAAIGQGCWRQQGLAQPKGLHTSDVRDPAQALVLATSLEGTDMDPRAPSPALHLSSLYRRARRFRWSGDCVNYALLCQGVVDVAIDSRMHPWDIAAVAVCVREAGGMLSAFDGNEDVVWQPNLIASANAALHQKVLEVVSADPNRLSSA